MTWEYFGATMIFALIGYLIGSVSFAVIITRKKHNEDVRTKGSGNAGATNTLRNYGAKTGLIVFILDVCKPILAALIAYEVKTHSDNFLSGTLIQATAFAAVIGHIYPVFFQFKGGKGAACMLGLFIVVNWLLAIIGFIIFVAIVYKTKIVSVGSILAPLLLTIVQITFIYTPGMNDAWSNPIAREPFLLVNTIFLFITWGIITLMHSGNIKRILKGQERKLGSKK